MRESAEIVEVLTENYVDWMASYYFPLESECSAFRNKFKRKIVMELQTFSWQEIFIMMKAKK